MQDWLSHRVRSTPGRTALVRAATGETLDFAGLDAMVDDLTERLATLGVESDDHVGMVMETRLAAVCTVFAAERLGAVLVPMGDDRTVRELRRQAEAADVTVLVCSAETETQAVDAFDGPVCSVDDPAHGDVAALGDTEPTAVDPATWELHDTRLLLFTSGTTGDPKAVRLTQGNLLWSAVASTFRLGLHRDDRWLVSLSLHHMGGLSPVLRMPLYGMTVVLRESFDAGGTADDIGNYDATCVSLVPTMLKRMLNLRGTLADSLRVVLLGGAPAPRDLLGRCRDFSIPVHPTYGMTETASQVATAPPREAFDHLGTVGRPLFWTDVSVRDEAGAAVDPGETGELVVDGPTVSPGYYDDPAATDAAFGPHGLRTGDVGYVNEAGRLFVVGRVDDRIITGGENVYPREVTDALCEHSSVADAAVVGLPDDEWGELVGALVVSTDETLTAADIDSHCRERLAGYKLPRVVAFVDELPRTDSGTVRRDEARRRLESGTATPGAVNAAEGEGLVPGGVDDADELPSADAPSDPEDEQGIEGTAVPRDDDGFLVAGTDWSMGAPGTDDRDAEMSSDADDAGQDEEETPDFVREVLPDETEEDADTEDGDEAADEATDERSSETGADES